MREGAELRARGVPEGDDGGRGSGREGSYQLAAAASMGGGGAF
jgi:hypothetical protein